MGMGLDLKSVEIRTHENALYVFPDVPEDSLKNVVLPGAWRTAGVFVLVNVSGSSLTLPARIVKTVSWDGKVQCDGPAVY